MCGQVFLGELQQRVGAAQLQFGGDIGTVQNHRANIATKLQLRGANALLQLAQENLPTHK